MLRLLITSGFAPVKALIGAYPITESAREKPADAKHVHGRANRPVPEAVFTRPELPGPMVHRDFHQTIAGSPDERGNESMHSLERDDGRNALALHRLHPAAGIADAVPRKTASDEIRDPAGGPLDCGIL